MTISKTLTLFPFCFSRKRNYRVTDFKYHSYTSNNKYSNIIYSSMYLLFSYLYFHEKKCGK